MLINKRLFNVKRTEIYFCRIKKPNEQIMAMAAFDLKNQ